MGINGSEFNYWAYASGCSGYYRTMADTYLDLSAYNKNYLWGAKWATSQLNNWTLYAAAPYSKMTVFPGGRAYFTVGDASRYSFGGGCSYSHADIQSVISTHAGSASVRAYSAQIGAKWHLVKSLSKLSSDKFLSDDSKAEVRGYVNQAKEALEELDTLLKNENGLSADELNEILAGKLAEVEAVVEETNQKYAEWCDEIREAQEERRQELEAGEEDDDNDDNGSSVRSGSGSASGTAKGKLVPEDELSVDTELSEVSKSRYGISPTASVQDCDNASELAESAVDDALSTKNGFLALFGKDKNINAGNIIEVLDEFNVDETVTVDGTETTRSELYNFVNKIAELKDNSKDYSTKALKEVAKLLKERVKLLAKAGHIDEETKKRVNTEIEVLELNASDVDSNKDKIVTGLVTIINALKGKGTEAVVTEAIEAKQEEAKALAAKEFRRDYAKAEGRNYDETETYARFNVEYLPNKRLFRVEINAESGTYYFEGGNYKEINEAIFACEKDDVITKWKEDRQFLLQTPEEG